MVEILAFSVVLVAQWEYGVLLQLTLDFHWDQVRPTCLPLKDLKQM